MITTKKEQQYSSWTKIIQKLHLAADDQALNQLMAQWIQPQDKKILAFVNAHAMNLAFSTPSFAADLLCADDLLRDGSGMAILLKWLGRDPGLNLNGTDLIPRIVRTTKAKTIALIGTRSPYLEQASQNLMQTLAEDKTMLIKDGFQAAESYVSFCQQHKPEIIVLGMGMPKQEQVATVLKQQLNHPCLIICGGAIIDFWGGKVSRAPLIVRKLNIEWIYRLALEPKRLFKRYVMGNPVFLTRSLCYIRTHHK